MLHITNGDEAAERIREAGLIGEIVSWRDALHEGPVPDSLTLDELRSVRAHFIAGAGWAPLPDVLDDLAARDAAVVQFNRNDEVVLWFEHDLYDQLQLLQALDFFARHDRSDVELTLVCRAEYLGPATPQRIRKLFDEREQVTQEQLDEARRAWAGFRSKDPREIPLDARALPFLAAALHRHLEQFPAVDTGLSRSERQILAALADEPTDVRDLFHRAHHDVEDPVFLGDSIFFWYLHGLADVEEPLVRRTGEHHVAVTDAGRAVLAGEADHVALNGIDKWLGGVHLKGHDGVWRWDTDQATLRR